MEEVSCLGNMGIKTIIKDIIGYIDEEEASCLGNRGI